MPSSIGQSPTFSPVLDDMICPQACNSGSHSPHARILRQTTELPVALQKDDVQRICASMNQT